VDEVPPGAVTVISSVPVALLPGAVAAMVPSLITV